MSVIFLLCFIDTRIYECDGSGVVWERQSGNKNKLKTNNKKREIDVCT